MAVTRKLTIAGMKGTFKLRFRDVANQDAQFQSLCGGAISVSRSSNGTTYIVTSDTDHFRVFATIVTPSDMPTLFYWDDCTAYGWWTLEGFAQLDFTAGGWPSLAAHELSLSDKLGKPKEAKCW